MTESPRMTVELDDGEVRLYVNRKALSDLIEKLSKLSPNDEHFHLFADEWGGAGDGLSLEPYEPHAKTAGHVKVMLRLDRWDREQFPARLNEQP